MKIGDIVNLTAGSLDMEVLGVDDKYVRVRLISFNGEATAAFARNILVLDPAKSVINQERREKRRKERESKRERWI